MSASDRATSTDIPNRDSPGSLGEVPSATAESQEFTFVRRCQDLAEPIQAVVTLSGLLLEVAEGQEGPTALVEDTRKMHEASQRLLDLVKEATEAAQSEPAGDGFEENLGRLAHNMRNALNAVSGFCQLVMQAEEAERFGAFLEDLGKIYHLCQEFEPKVLQFPCPPPASPLLPDWGAELPGSLRVKPGNLLIVDDSPIGRELLRRLLEPQGHQITEADNGIRALEMMRESPFDLILLDILMAGMNGFQFLEQLKAQPNLPRCSVIVITGMEDPQSAIRCLELGAEDYLTKPIERQLLQARVNSCLQKRQLHLRELEQFFPPRVAQDLLHRPSLLHVGREAQITVLFGDIRGFSKITEDQRLGPGKVIEWLSEVMEVLSECVLGKGGVVVDFQGDEILAMWGAPDEQSNHAELACDAALEMLAKVQELSRKWHSILGGATEVGIGISSGPARVGNTGTRRRLKYGPLGNTVNLGSRVQGATKYFKTNLLISQSTQELLDGRFAVRRLATVKVVNINAPVDLYEVAPPDQSHWPAAKSHYEQALDLFESRKLEEASQILGALIAGNGCRGPELWLLSRTIECMSDPNKWSREWSLPQK
jgi:adenylate cyclase